MRLILKCRYCSLLEIHQNCSWLHSWSQYFKFLQYFFLYGVFHLFNINAQTSHSVSFNIYRRTYSFIFSFPLNHFSKRIFSIKVSIHWHKHFVKQLPLSTVDFLDRSEPAALFLVTPELHPIFLLVLRVYGYSGFIYL